MSRSCSHCAFAQTINVKEGGSYGPPTPYRVPCNHHLMQDIVEKNERLGISVIDLDLASSCQYFLKSSK